MIADKLRNAACTLTGSPDLMPFTNVLCHWILAHAAGRNLGAERWHLHVSCQANMLQAMDMQ